MKIAKTFRNRLLAIAAIALALTAIPVPAHATSKEMIELQTQVQQLLDMVQRLQSTVDARFGVMQHLVEQTAESANQMNATISALQQKIGAQSEATGGKLDAVSGQVQSLNDSVDELKSRLAKLDKSLADLQAQLQAAQAPAAGATPAGQTPADPNAQPQGGSGALHYYPMDDLAGSAQFYLGEIAYHQEDYADAVKAYNAVLEGFSGSPRAPAAQLKKGLALLQLQKKDQGVRELRQLIQRHPQTPEADQARKKLNGMGVRINPPAAAAAH